MRYSHAAEANVFNGFPPTSMLNPVLPTSFARGRNHQWCGRNCDLTPLNPFLSFFSKEGHLCPQTPSPISIPQSPLPFRLLLNLFHGKMQLLTGFPAEFPGCPMKQYLADHFAVHSACWIQGKETAMRSFGKLFFSDLACPAESQESDQQTPSSNRLHPL